VKKDIIENEKLKDKKKYRKRKQYVKKKLRRSITYKSYRKREE